MVPRARRVLALVSISVGMCAASCLSAGLDWIGPNLLTNPDFEIASDRGLPVDWTVTATPAGTAKFSLDQQVFLVGKAALKAEVPDTGAATVHSRPVPVEGGKWYLVSVGYRTEGFGQLHAHLDGHIGVVGIVDRNIDLFIHAEIPSRYRRT